MSLKGFTNYMENNANCKIIMICGHFIPWWIYRFLIIQTVGRTPWAGDQPTARTLPTQGNTKRINVDDIHAFSGIRTHHPSVKRAKTVHALDRAATLIGVYRPTGRFLPLEPTKRKLFKSQSHLKCLNENNLCTRKKKPALKTVSTYFAWSYLMWDINMWRNFNTFLCNE
jgi:hypothetical protein